jgi:MFS family permease
MLEARQTVDTKPAEALPSREGMTSETETGTKLGAFANTFSAFRIPAYRLVWLSQVSSTSGMQMQMFARGLLAYELGGTAGAIGVVGLGQAIPQGLFSMFGGTVADRFERRRVMMVTQALTAVVAVIVSILVRADMMTIPLLFLAGLTQGTVMSFGGPARQAFVPEVVGEKELMNALALNNAAMNLSRIGAPSLAGTLVGISWIDLGGLYEVQAGLNIFSLLLLFLLPAVMAKGPYAKAASANAASAHARRRQQRTGSIFSAWMDGIRYIRTSPILLTLLALGLVPTLLGQSYQQYLPVFAKNVFGDGIDRNAHALGLMGTMSGVGALLGALAVASLSAYRRRTQLQLVAGLGFGLFVALFAVQSNYGMALVMLVGCGFMSSFFQSLNSTMVMSATDPEYYGRVMSVNMLTFSLQAFGTFGTGYLIDFVGELERGRIDLIGVQLTFWGLGMLIMAFVVGVTLFNPRYRRLEQDDLTRLKQPARSKAEAVVS